MPGHWHQSLSPMAGTDQYIYTHVLLSLYCICMAQPRTAVPSFPCDHKILLNISQSSHPFSINSCSLTSAIGPFQVICADWLPCRQASGILAVAAAFWAVYQSKVGLFTERAPRTCHAQCGISISMCPLWQTPCNGRMPDDTAL